MDAQLLTPEQAQSLLASFTPESLGALIAALGLSADQVSPETILAAVQALAEKCGQVDSVTAQVAGLNAQLAELQAAETERQNQALNTELAGYDLGEPEMAVLRGLPNDQRAALLAKMPKKQEASSASSSSSSSEGGGSSSSANPPPEPMHDPRAGAQATATKADRDAAVAAYQKAHPGATFSAAWSAVRREKPELFSDSKSAA